jgi:pimeloyl-ACP methyl ester carboxylesterase
VAGFTTFDGIELAYEDEGDGAPVVLLHGFAADTNVNFVRAGVLDRLLDEGYRVIALDARGHGLSDKPHDPSAYADDAMCRDAGALLDHLGLEACCVVGYSMGAATALRLAIVDERPRALALLGAGENLVDPDGSVERRAALAQGFGTGPVDSLPSRVQAFRTMADSIHCDIAALGAFLAAPWPDTAADLAGVTVPVLVVCGADDEEVGDPRALVDRLPDATLATVPGDHFTANSRPELHEALVTFLARVALP